MTRFDLCWPLILREENGDWYHHPADWSSSRCFSNSPHDTGGATMCGIIQREYDHFRKVHGEHVQFVRNISLDEGQQIYFNWYWLRHCPRLPAGLDLSFFDASVNEGTFEAIKILQHSLGLVVDGEWGPVTSSAVNRISPREAVVAFAASRLKIYEEMKAFQYFGKDWTERTERIKEASLRMIDG